MDRMDNHKRVRFMFSPGCSDYSSVFEKVKEGLLGNQEERDLE
jgi:hypothetical protein